MLPGQSGALSTSMAERPCFRCPSSRSFEYLGSVLNIHSSCCGFQVLIHPAREGHTAGTVPRRPRFHSVVFPPSLTTLTIASAPHPITLNSKSRMDRCWPFLTLRLLSQETISKRGGSSSSSVMEMALANLVLGLTLSLPLPPQLPFLITHLIPRPLLPLTAIRCW